MRFPIQSLRTSVMAHLAFLILAAMLLINVVMIKYAEKHLIQKKVQTGRLLLNTLAHMVKNETLFKNRPWKELESDPRFKVEVARLLKSGDFSEALILNRHGTKIFSSGTWHEAEKNAMSISRECLTTRKLAYDFYGTTWGIIWLAHERVNMSAPVLIEGRLLGVTTIGGSLSPLYGTLRQSEKVILAYIFLNTIILVVFGVYLLSRIVVKPIHELLSITEEFKDVEKFPPLTDAPENEIGQLFRSLNMMLRRLEQNKKELKEYISSLEKANQQIKKAQDEIIRSEKLASVGRLATGVAHEIGNPIGIVLGYLELLKGNELEKEERLDFLDRMESEITRINQIIRDLLDFSRSSTGTVKQISIHKLIKETLEMLEPQPMMAHVKIKPVLEAPRDTVQADLNQLKQVFLNIIMNAADAMDKSASSGDGASGNLLTIKTENRGNSIELRFTDTGPGIRQEELVRIFDPFYTTKEPGKGTGLGLSVCYSIIDGLRGKIHAESTRGNGATIIVNIPFYQGK